MYWISFFTLFRKEVRRFLRIWSQTLLPPLITTTLYFLIFGAFMGNRIGSIEQVNYIHYIAPGLIMMAVINNAYANVSSSVYGMRFQRSIEELLICPMPNYLLLLGFVSGGIARGLIVGVAVTALSLLFTHLTIHSVIVLILIVPLTTLLFSLAGFTNALFARTFDDIAFIPTFILTPLIYLGGVFYSIQMLSPFWKTISLFNPILYIVNTFRYSIIGISDIPVGYALCFILICCIGLFIYNLYLLNRGQGLQT
jgi:ABC-2 type transport system permease protein